MHLPKGTRRAIVLPAIAAVFAFLAAPVHASDVVTTSRMYPISGRYVYSPSVPCGCAPAGDVLHLSGVIHMMTQAEPGPTGIAPMNRNPIDVAGTRATTRCTYRAARLARLPSHTP